MDDKLRARVIGALKKDFEALYVKESSTRWEIERLVRGIEIDIMGLSNIIALFPDCGKCKVLLSKVTLPDTRAIIKKAAEALSDKHQREVEDAKKQERERMALDIGGRPWKSIKNSSDVWVRFPLEDIQALKEGGKKCIKPQ